MARFNALIQAVPRNHNGQQFMDYWFLGKHWSGVNPTQAELDEDQLKEIQVHEKAGYPIRVLEVAEVLPPAPEVAPLEVVSPPATPPTAEATPPPPVVTPVATDPSIPRPPWAPAV